MAWHARLAASDAKRWVNCAGSIKASEGRADEESIFAAEGTVAHDIAGACLLKRGNPQTALGAKYKMRAGTIDVTQDMVDGIQVYLDAINDVRTEPGQEWVELSLHDALRKLDPDMGGTADWVHYNPETRHLIVADLKFGAGVYVEAEDNQQALIYAIGAMLQIGKPVDTLEIMIVQPRYAGAEPVRRWKFDAVEVLQHAATFKAAAAATRLDNPPLKSGSWCKFCKAARDCPELEKAQHAVIAVDFDSLPSRQMPPEQVAKVLQLMPLVKERLRAIEEYAYTLAAQGVEIPGYKLVEKRPTRKWKSTGAVIEWAEQVGIDPYAPRDVVSPAQLEARIKEAAPRGQKEARVKEFREQNDFIESVSSGTTLAPVGDGRAPVKRISADDFTAIEGTVEKKEVDPLSLLP